MTTLTKCKGSVIGFRPKTCISGKGICQAVKRSQMQPKQKHQLKIQKEATTIAFKKCTLNVSENPHIRIPNAFSVAI